MIPNAILLHSRIIFILHLIIINCSDVHPHSSELIEALLSQLLLSIYYQFPVLCIESRVIQISSDNRSRHVTFSELRTDFSFITPRFRQYLEIRPRLIVASAQGEILQIHSPFRSRGSNTQAATHSLPKCACIRVCQHVPTDHTVGRHTNTHNDSRELAGATTNAADGEFASASQSL